MSKHLTSLCILSLFLGAIADANAASTIKITCDGSLTNTRADGVTLGQRPELHISETDGRDTDRLRNPRHG